jgi:hypothetical protein
MSAQDPPDVRNPQQFQALYGATIEESQAIRQLLVNHASQALVNHDGL